MAALTLGGSRSGPPGQHCECADLWQARSYGTDAIADLGTGSPGPAPGFLYLVDVCSWPLTDLAAEPVGSFREGR